MFAGMSMLAVAAMEAAHDVANAATHEAAKSGLPQLNTHYFSPQLFWLALTFLALLFMMWKVALPRIGEVIDERRERIARDIEAAGRLKAETDKALADYEKALADARSKASGIAKQTREKIAAETETKKASVEKTLAGQLADAEKRIVESKSKALSAVNDIATDTAGAIVSKLIGQNVSADDVKKALNAGAGE